MTHPFRITNGFSAMIDDVVDWFDGDEPEQEHPPAPPRPSVDYRSLFNDDPVVQTKIGSGLTGVQQVVQQPSLVDEASDPRFPAFQQAWREGKPVEELLGDEPYRLKTRIAGNGGDNWRPDVAKVQVLLNKGGYHNIIPEEGPNGYHSTALDRDIRSFQRANKLAVDGKLSPDGETIRALERQLSQKPKETPALDGVDTGEATPVTVQAPSNDTSIPKPDRPPPPAKRAPGRREFKAADWESEAVFEQVVGPVFKHEGGYSNNEFDRGGETNYGITKDTLEEYQMIHGGFGQGGTPVGPKELTKTQAKEIYRNEFYYGQRLNEIKNPNIVAALIDAQVLHGPKRAWRFMQQAINTIDNANTLVTDGVGGSTTIAKINSLSKSELMRMIEENDKIRRNFISDIVTSNQDQKVFSRRWQNRLNEVNRRVLGNVSKEPNS